MSAADSKIRRDGWTPERQLRFLDTLVRTQSITKAARAAGMSRESAYRLRSRKGAALFAAAWDRALEGHKLVPVTSSRSKRRGPIFRGNASKVTKLVKRTTSRFERWESLLRDFRKLPV